MKRVFEPLWLLCCVLFLAGCQTTSQYRNSSVVDYLYPKSDQHVVSEEIPRLVLPLKVGVAFTPGSHGTSLTEASKMELMSDVSKHFESLDFVDSIEVIPSGYLRPEGSFANLEQLKRMFGIDVIALISYDQTRFTDEGFASIAYWTLVGAYLVPGEKNATHTLIDAVLYDIDSQKLLFRAPGVSVVKSKATPVNLKEQVREDSLEGFQLASEDLVGNLKVQLDRFQTRVESTPEQFEVIRSEGYRGSGSSGYGFLLLLGLLFLRSRKG
ncbi:rhombotarget lipoprotein [Endozoicomonas lisbonensis]|uniref:Rhombotail lipoprotein n=1 Tax=Endozoicomonas lisbonensis TaxID=3120522 RepID=A0ABV2SJN2_9GAMM